MLEERRCPVCGETYLPMVESCKKEACRKENKPLLVVSTLLGEVLDQRYRLDQILGYGGMGVVYRATHVKTRQERAVKVLHPEMIEKEGMLRRFETEAVAASMIESDKAVKIVDFQVTSEKLAYLVMEMVEGVVLRNLITPEGMEYQRAVEIICQICEAVHAAHEKRIIHRDLKPDNVIVKRAGTQDRVKVLDFGIAKLREADQTNATAPLTKVGTIMGTPHYMSPEQCRGIRSEDLKPASDVYSIGIIAYEMLCGRVPFDGQNTLELIDKHKNEPPPHLKTYNSSVPFSIATVVMKSLAKMPEDRWESAEKLAQEFRIAVREARAGKTVPNEPVVTEVLTGPLPFPNQPTADFGTNEVKERATMPIEKVSPIPAPSPAPAPAPKPVPQQPNWILRGVIAAGVMLLASAGIYWLTGKGPIQDEALNINNLPKTINDKFGEMVLIPGGKFTMGNSNGAEDEQPEQENVEVKPFYLDTYEVTNQQYKEFVDATGYRKPEHWLTGAYPQGQARFPVTHVTWTDATAYAKWAGKRLPRETEWEFAARGGNKQFLFPWGNQWIAGRANYRTNKLDAVGNFADDVSSFGIHDLAGSVSEWVEDRFQLYGTTRPAQMACPDCRVYRGGSYAQLTETDQITNTTRFAYLPDWTQNAEAQDRARRSVSPLVGFRCAKDVLSNK